MCHQQWLNRWINMVGNRPLSISPGSHVVGWRELDLRSVCLVGNISSATSSLGNHSEVTYFINHSLLIYVMGTKSPPASQVCCQNKWIKNKQNNQRTLHRAGILPMMVDLIEVQTCVCVQCASGNVYLYVCVWVPVFVIPERSEYACNTIKCGCRSFQTLEDCLNIAPLSSIAQSCC